VRKTYLIVGASSGIGHAVASRLAADEAELLVASRRRPDDVGSWGARHIELDVTSDDMSALAEALPNVVHGLVYCPGTINLKPFQSLTPDDFRHDFEVNLLGGMKILRLLLPSLRKAEGASVVLFSTVAARAGMGFHASIASAKAAVEGLAVSLAAEWARWGIRVNVIAPSLTDTPLAGRLLADDKRRDAAAQRHPLGRVGTPVDQAEMVLFLLDSKSSWLTGQVIGVDGGLSTLRPA
jgi:NAD(P)-dependent dehydrogenase (short-subunit alcohol dehydrogenase family)